MGLINGGLSFRRYRIYQPLPEGFRDTFLEGIQEFAFQENLQYRSKEPLVGWVNVFNADDTAFVLNKILYDRYLVLGLRVDKKSINGKLLAILLERRYREVMREKGVERLGKNHKDEIKQALEEELLGQTLPSVATYDLAWDIHTGEVMVFATSDAIHETIQGLFHDTFNARLYPERMADWLAEQWDWETLTQRIDATLPGGARDREHIINDEGWHEGNPLRGHELILGSEFLSWLWHQSELKDGWFKIVTPKKAPTVTGSAITERSEILSDEEVDYDYRTGEKLEAMAAAGLEAPQTKKGGTDDEDEITLWLDNKLTFRDLEQAEQPGFTTMVGEAPSSSPVARMTMQSGKRPVEARLGLRRGEGEWFFTLRVGPGGLELNGLKLPVEVKDGEEEKIFERMYLLDVLSGAVRGLFRQFFEVRTGEQWPGLIENWIDEEGGSTDES